MSDTLTPAQERRFRTLCRFGLTRAQARASLSLDAPSAPSPAPAPSVPPRRPRVVLPPMEKQVAPRERTAARPPEPAPRGAGGWVSITDRVPDQAELARQRLRKAGR